MSTDLQQRIDSHLQRIANLLLLNASFIDNLGLLNGKMGIAIFFYHYARYCNNTLYSDFAGELIDEIYEEISKNTPVDFANGLTGIGWGIEYLVKNGFVEADTDEALSEMDAGISKAISEGIWDNLSLQHIADCGNYYLTRLKDTDSGESLFNKKHNLLLLLSECEKNFVFKPRNGNEFPLLHTMNQLLYFVLELHKTGLFQERTGRLLQLLPSLLFTANSIKLDAVEVDFTKQLISHFQTILENSGVGLPYAELVIGLSKDVSATPSNDEIETTLKNNLTRILYGVENVSQSNNNKSLNFLIDDISWN